MCDPGLILGIASGVASTAGQAQAAADNQEMIRKQTILEYASQERELLVQADAANKEGYQSQLETDRAVALAKVTGEGMGGATAAARIAEQQRQGALSIANAKDRRDNAKANYTMAGRITQTTAQNDINRQAVNPLTAFTNIAASGMSGYGTLGSFPTANSATTPTGHLK
ncbi:hypothetical protein [Ciceribacter azotifigens]|uniref:virion core protein, T7 gp14 family n=1 Tax=Ciceribacter azotifigens TaxID=2069303 RepID=UPI003A84C2BB